VPPYGSIRLGKYWTFLHTYYKSTNRRIECQLWFSPCWGQRAKPPPDHSILYNKHQNKIMPLSVWLINETQSATTECHTLHPLSYRRVLSYSLAQWSGQWSWTDRKSVSLTLYQYTPPTPTQRKCIEFATSSRRLPTKIWKLNMLRIYPAELCMHPSAVMTQFTILQPMREK